MKNYFPNFLATNVFSAALVSWGALAFAAETPVPVPVPAPVLTWEKDIQPIITDNCTFCHTGTSASGNLVLETQDQVLKVKTNIINLVSKGLMPEGDPDFATRDEGKKLLEWLKASIIVPAPVTYAKDIKPIIDEYCLSCHTKGNAEHGVAFDTEAQVVSARKKIASEVSKGAMPEGDKTFKNSAEAKVLLDWIKSLDVKPAS